MEREQWEVTQILHQATLRYPGIFRGARKRLGFKWSTVCKQPILARRDYEDPDFESLMEKVQEKWASYLSQDLPAIRKLIHEME